MRVNTTPEQRILALKVCDPACGSGHFLIAAANRMAKALAAVRTGEEEPPPNAIQEAKRDIISHCIYGVDINPMAVELCKVNLWMEALEPGKPLSFLDHRILVGNSLLGTTPRLMANGIPDDAFNPIEGDDPKFAATMKKRNKDERKQRGEMEGKRQRGLFDAAPANYRALHDATLWIDRAPDDTLAQVRLKEQMYHEMANDPEYIKARLLADAWCAAFVWEKRPLTLNPSPTGGEGLDNSPSPRAAWERGQGGEGLSLPMTDLLYRELESNALADNLQPVRATVVELKERYQFFHWHVAFPDVFSVPENMAQAENEQTGWQGGFSCVLGNPPWEEIRPEEKKFFSAIVPEISLIENRAQRQKAIDKLEVDNPFALHLWHEHRRRMLATTHFLHASQNFPLSSQGNLDTSPIFIDLARQVINWNGYSSMIVPSSIVTAKGSSKLFEDLMERNQIHSLYDFENRKLFFPAVHSSMHFSLVTLRRQSHQQIDPLFGFFMLEVNDISDADRIYALTSHDIRRVNPNSYVCPVFRNRHSADLVIRVHAKNPIILSESGENLWKIDTTRMFEMSHEADELKEEKVDNRVPVWEGKMVAQYNHRAGTIILNLNNQARQAIGEPVPVTKLRDASFSPNPRYWVEANALNRKLANKWIKDWLIVFCRITSPTNERTCLVSIIPRYGTVESLFHIYPEEAVEYSTSLVANLNSFALDFILREKMGGITLSHFIFRQLPVIAPDTYTPQLLDFIVPRVLELTYTAWDLQPFAQDVGYHGAPFVWDEDRRFLMRCELDALYFHLYQIQRDDVDYIMDTFPIVRRKDEASYGEYRTKRVILEMYDDMVQLPPLHVPAPKDENATYAVPDVSQYQTRLSPPPADERAAHK